MLVLKTFKISFKPISFLILFFIFGFISIFPAYFISLNFKGDSLNPLNFYLNFLQKKDFFGVDLTLKTNFNLKEFFESQMGFLFLISFILVFILYHIFLPLIYRNLKGEKLTFIFKNSIIVLIFGLIQMLIYLMIIYLYFYFSNELKEYTDNLPLETYSIALNGLLEIFFILLLLILRYFFSFIKVLLSFEQISFSIIKKSFLLSFKNFFNLTIFNLLLFGINYLILSLLGGNIINVFTKTYFLLLSLSYYLILSAEV